MGERAPLLIVDDPLEALATAGARGAGAIGPRIIAITGSVGKTSTKEALRLALAASGDDPCLGSVLQQSLGRAAVAGADAGQTRPMACSRSA